MIASWNPGAERLFGYAADEVVGKSVTVLFPEDLLHEETVILERIRRGEKIEHYDTVRRRKDGSLVDISLTVSPLRNAAGKITGVSKIARDISMRKKAEHERALALQDEERRRIANELHELDRTAFGGNRPQLDEDKRGCSGDQITRYPRRNRGITRGSRKGTPRLHLSPAPTGAAKGGIVRRRSDDTLMGSGTRTGLKITLKSCRRVDQLSLQLQQTLLRIVQEALTNVYRHASATHVSVNFRYQGKRLRLVISDDGQGTGQTSGHQHRKPSRLGIGIPGMMARMQQVGGNLDIHSGPNGTAVHATVPLG